MIILSLLLHIIIVPNHIVLLIIGLLIVLIANVVAQTHGKQKRAVACGRRRALSLDIGWIFGDGCAYRQ